MSSEMPAGNSVKTSELLEYYVTTLKICVLNNKHAFPTCPWEKKQQHTIWAEAR